MKIAVLGTGPVGRTLAARFATLGHEVAIGTRDVAGTMARTEPDAWGGPAFPVWVDEHPDVRLADFAEAAAHAELVVNATNGAGSLAALTLAGADNLAGKVLQAEPAQLAGGDHSVFVSGDDADAKRAVTVLLESLGHTDVIDLGDITTARGTEMYLPLWLRLWGSLGTPILNIKVVR